MENRKSISKEVSAGIIIYCMSHDGPRFLLLYHGGRYWNFPKGHLEAEENSYRAALREVREESGLSRNVLSIHQGFKAYERYSFSKAKQRIFKVVIYFLAESSDLRVRVSHEHYGYGWFLYRDAMNMILYKNGKENLKKAYAYIRDNQR